MVEVVVAGVRRKGCFLDFLPILLPREDGSPLWPEERFVRAQAGLRAPPSRNGS